MRLSTKFDSLSQEALANSDPEDSGWHHLPEDQDAGSPASRDKVRHAPLEGGVSGAKQSWS
jgi:hypothetical protein